VQVNRRKIFQQKPVEHAIGFLCSILLKCEGKPIPFFSLFKNITKKTFFSYAVLRVIYYESYGSLFEDCSFCYSVYCRLYGAQLDLSRLARRLYGLQRAYELICHYWHSVCSLFYQYMFLPLKPTFPFSKKRRYLLFML
jgi:hypothetical protein